MLICIRNFGFGCNLGGKKKSAYKRACLVKRVVSLGGKSRYLLELLTALTGAVRNLSVLSKGMNNLLMYLYYLN